MGSKIHKIYERTTNLTFGLFFIGDLFKPNSYSGSFSYIALLMNQL